MLDLGRQAARLERFPWDCGIFSRLVDIYVGSAAGRRPIAAAAVAIQLL
jgi:hypothetical protein